MLTTQQKLRLRSNRLKDVFAERAKNEGVVVVPGVVIKEMEYTHKKWDDSMNYMPIPDTDSSKNKNL